MDFITLFTSPAYAKKYIQREEPIVKRSFQFILSLVTVLALSMSMVSNSWAKPDDQGKRVKNTLTAQQRMEELELKRSMEEMNLQMGLGLSEQLRDGYLELEADFSKDADIVSWSEYRIAEYEYSRDDFNAASNRLKAIVKKYPTSDIATEAQIFIADILDSPYNPKRDSVAAAAVMDKLQNDQPQNDRVQVARAKRSEAKHFEKKNMRAAKSDSSLKNVSKPFRAKNSRDSWKDQFFKNKYNEDLTKLRRYDAFVKAGDGDYQTAYQLLDQLASNYSGDNPYDYFSFSTTVEDLEYQKALALAAQGKKREAVEELTTFISNHPNSYLSIRALDKIDSLDPKAAKDIKLDNVDSQQTRGTLNPDQICICGPAALRAAFNQMGVQVSLQKLMDDAGTNDDGTTMLGMVKASRSAGVNAYAVHMETSTLAQAHFPAVLLLDRHYVTVTDMSNGQVTLYDSARGWLVQSQEQFNQDWSGNAVLFGDSKEGTFGGLKGARELTAKEQKQLSGKYQCGNAGGSPGGGGAGSATGAGDGTGQCAALYAVNDNLAPESSDSEDTLLAVADDIADEDGMGGPTTGGCQGANPLFERHDPAADGKMDGIISSVNRIYGNHNLVTPALLLRGSENTYINYTLSYNSQASTRDGAVGLGWSTAYSDTLTNVGNNYQWVASDGARNTFTINIDGSFTSPPGVSDILLQNADGTLTIVRANRSTMQFSTDGRLLSSLDSNAQGVSLTYDSNKLLSRLTDTQGLELTFSYGANNKIASIQASAEHKVSFIYSGSNLTQIQFPDGQSWSFGYTNGFLTDLTDRGGKKTSFEYNQYGQLLAKVNAAGARRTYGASNSSTPISDYSGATKSFTRDDSRRITSVTDTLGKTVYYTYNPDNKITSVTDALGNKMYYNYNSKGDMIASIDATGNKTLYAYDNQSHLTSVTNALNRTTNFEYDDQGNATKVTDAKGNTTSYTYDNLGHLLSVTNAAGRTTRYEYDSHGWLVRTVSATGAETLYTYDVLGHRISETDASGNKMQFKYDFYGHIIDTIYPDGTKETNTYQGENLMTQTDRKGYTTTYTYDDIDRLIHLTFADGSALKYGYDVQGRATSFTDQLGNVTTQTYDSKGRLVKVTYPDASEETYNYDAVGRVISKTNTDGTTTTNTYDALGRILQTETK